MNKGSTIYDIAKAVGVSPMTVSLALRPASEAPRRVSAATRARVLKAARSLRYRANPTARALSRGRAFNIGFHVNLSGFQWNSPLWSDLMVPLQSRLWELGHQLGFYYFPPDRTAELGRFLTPHRFVDGLVTLGRNLNAKEIQAMRRSGLRLVSLYERIAGFTSLLVDECGVGRAAADYLYARGHRKAGIIANRLPTTKRWNERIAGFLARAGEIGLEVPESARLLSHEAIISGSERLIARALFRKFLAGSLPLRCFWTPSDFMAFGVVEELDERGLRLGRDFSILSYDNLEDRGYAPWGGSRLTSYNPPYAEIGRKAAEILAEQSGDAEGDLILFSAQLVERGSVANVGG